MCVDYAEPRTVYALEELTRIKIGMTQLEAARRRCQFLPRVESRGEGRISDRVALSAPSCGIEFELGTSSQASRLELGVLAAGEGED